MLYRWLGKTLAKLSVVAVALCVFSAGEGACEDGLLLRVGLASWGFSVKSIVFSSASGLKLFDASGSMLLETEGDECIRLSADGGVFVTRVGLQVKSSPGPFVVAVSRASDAITIQSADNKRARRYRGKIEARLKPVGMQLINIVSLEDYIMGVVSAEMPSSYPLEALKAQAITARTYALANFGKHRAEDFDLCDTSHCQTYNGVSAETPRAAEAVRTTEELVLTYEGKLASVMYSSDCGGATQDISEVRPNVRLPYLCSVTEPMEIPHITWEFSMSLPELKEKLVSGGLKQCANMSAISVAKISSSGRVLQFEIVTDSGKIQIEGHKVRSALGLSLVKSLLLTVEQTQDGIVIFKGKGAGHGIGLCQVGTKWLASAPTNWSYEQILEHYFPGTRLQSLRAISASGVVRVLKTLPQNLPTDTLQRTSIVDESRYNSESIARHRQSESGCSLAFDVRVEAPDGL